MSILLFGAALLGIVVFAVVVNRLTGTQALYLETLQRAADEKELWRDAGADFAEVPHNGRAVIMSYPRLRRHTVVWTDRRIIIAAKTLLSAKHMITHQIYFATAAGSAEAQQASRELFGGFYGRGFQTIVAATRTFGQVNGKHCVRIQPTADSSANLNLAEALVFTDRLAELKQSLPANP